MLRLLSSHVIFMLKAFITYILKEVKNTIKIKYNYVFFSWFIDAVSWLALFLFVGPVAIAIDLTVSYAIDDGMLIASKIAIGYLR